MPMPTENCARATAGIEASVPTMRAFERNRLPKVFIRNLSSTVVLALKEMDCREGRMFRQYRSRESPRS